MRMNITRKNQVPKVVCINEFTWAICWIINSELHTLLFDSKKSAAGHLENLGSLKNDISKLEYRNFLVERSPLL